jgi:dTDP-4-dehydrorhamnose reductase
MLIVGSTGMLGRTVKKYFSSISNYEVSVLNRRNIDLAKCSYNELLYQLKFEKYDVVVNCAGLIVQRKGTAVEDFLKVNSVIPRWMANICDDLGIQMFHPTTDCIYNGDNGPYIEGDTYTESGIYGISKALGEAENCCVIRSSIIGEEEHNKLSFLEWVRSNEGNTVNGYTNHLWNGITCLEMCKIIDEIIQSDKYYLGTKHYYSPTVTKADMVTYVNEVYDLDISVIPISTGGVIDKSLTSKYTKQRKDLKEQIQEQRDFWL